MSKTADELIKQLTRIADALENIAVLHNTSEPELMFTYLTRIAGKLPAGNLAKSRLRRLLCHFDQDQRGHGSKETVDSFRLKYPTPDILLQGVRNRDFFRAEGFGIGCWKALIPCMTVDGFWDD